jgi:hypothetical protein
METAPKRVVGKPFEKGDLRINRIGRPPAILTKAMLAKLTPEKADTILDQVILAAERGEPWAIAMLWERTEGKAVARNENGEAGSFDLDLSGWSDADVKQAVKKLRRVK